MYVPGSATSRPTFEMVQLHTTKYIETKQSAYRNFIFGIYRASTDFRTTHWDPVFFFDGEKTTSSSGLTKSLPASKNPIGTSSKAQHLKCVFNGIGGEQKKSLPNSGEAT